MDNECTRCYAECTRVHQQRFTQWGALLTRAVPARAQAPIAAFARGVRVVARGGIRVPTGWVDGGVDARQWILCPYRAFRNYTFRDVSSIEPQLPAVLAIPAEAAELARQQRERAAKTRGCRPGLAIERQWVLLEILFSERLVSSCDTPLATKNRSKTSQMWRIDCAHYPCTALTW